MLSKMRGITLYEPAEGDGELQEFTPTVRQLQPWRALSPLFVQLHSRSIISTAPVRQDADSRPTSRASRYETR